MASQRDLLLNVVEKKEGNALSSAANDLEKLSRGVDATGGAMRDMESDAKRLNTEIDKTRAHIKDLHVQFAKTGDTSLFGDIRKEEARLRNLEKTVKAIGVSATNVTNDFSKQLSSAFSDIPLTPISIGVITALAVPFAAILGAVISGAVVGTVGTGGLIGGILAASHDSRVKDAFKGLLDNVKEEFFGAGSSFVDPLLKSTAILDKAFHDLNLGSLFAEIAPQLEVITKGFSDLVTHALPGLNNLLGRSGAFADVAGKGLAYLGESLGVFLDEVSSSPGALEGLEAFFSFAGEAIKALGVSLHFLSDIFHNLVEFFASLSDAAAQFFDIMGNEDLARDMRDNAQQLHNLAKEGEAAAGQLAYAKDVSSAVGRAFTEQEKATYKVTQATLKAAEAQERENDELKNTLDLIDQAINQALGLDNAQLALSKDMKGLSDAVKENGKHWNDNTDAAYNNRQMILGAIGDLERVRDAEIKAGGSVSDANAEFEAGLAKILNYAGALGATKDQLDKIKGRYDIVVAVSIIGDVLGNLGKKLAGVIPHFAAGGTTPANEPFLVGEQGPELMYSEKPRYVVPNGQMASGGSATTTVVFNVPPDALIGQGMVAYLAKFVQTSGGGNVQLAITGRTA